MWTSPRLGSQRCRVRIPLSAIFFKTYFQMLVYAFLLLIPKYRVSSTIFRVSRCLYNSRKLSFFRRKWGKSINLIRILKFQKVLSILFHSWSSNSCFSMTTGLISVIEVSRENKRLYRTIREEKSLILKLASTPWSPKIQKVLLILIYLDFRTRFSW